MFDVITFGSACWDVFLKLNKISGRKNKELVSGKGICFNLGSKIDIDDIFFASGGGGTNAAATFARQGFRVAYFGTVGKDLAGEEIIKELEKLGIETRFISKTNLKPTNHSVILNTGPTKDRTVLAYRGASKFLDKKDIAWLEKGTVPMTKWFYLAPLSGQAAEFTEKIVNFAYKNKIKIAINPGAFQLSLLKAVLKRILKKADILFLNQEEASLLTGVAYQKEKEIFKKLDQICSGIAIMGSNDGITVSDGKYLYKARSSLTRPVDRTGAGDAFSSGFVSGFVKKGEIEYAVQLGMANSAACVQQWGAKNGLLKKGESFKKVKVIKKKL